MIDPTTLAAHSMVQSFIADYVRQRGEFVAQDRSYLSVVMNDMGEPVAVDLAALQTVATSPENLHPTADVLRRMRTIDANTYGLMRQATTAFFQSETLREGQNEVVSNHFSKLLSRFVEAA